MKITSGLVGSCAMAFLWGCSTGPDDELTVRNGTSGYGSGTDGGTDLSSGGWGMDLGGGGWRMDLGGGGWDAGGEEPEIPEIEDNCQVFGQAAGDPATPPFKTPAGLWDQGSTKACGYFALLNGNIAMGADDTEGAFHARLLACLAVLDVDPEDIYDGLTTTEMAKVAICKEDEMKKDDKPVKFSAHGFAGEKKLLDQCQKMEDALEGGGSATVGFQNGADKLGHTMRVTEVECDPAADTAELTVSDPNNPAAGTFKVVVNCDDVVTGVMPVHPWLLNGFKAVALYIETAL